MSDNDDWRGSMGVPAVLSGWDTFVLAVPFLAILGMAMFRMDERIAAPRRDLSARRLFCGVDEKGSPFMSDPDGKPWRSTPMRHIEGRLVSTRAAD